MSTQSLDWRKRAEKTRIEADSAFLLNVRIRLLASAKRFDELAEQVEQLETLRMSCL